MGCPLDSTGCASCVGCWSRAARGPRGLPRMRSYSAHGFPAVAHETLTEFHSLCNGQLEVEVRSCAGLPRVSYGLLTGLPRVAYRIVGLGHRFPIKMCKSRLRGGSWVHGFSSRVAHGVVM